jgi:D-arginine dehydrogenase
MEYATEVLVIGGGVAGAGAAYEISAFAAVTVLEREPQCGYHSTGRSAASFTENYGNAVVRRLAIASRAFLETPPAGFCEHPLLSPRGLITIARNEQLALLEQQLAVASALVPSIVAIDGASAVARVPILRSDHVAGAVFEPHSREIEVSALHQGFLRGAKARGATIKPDTAVEAIEFRGERWLVETATDRFWAPVIVNAAGAWADEVATLAGIAPLGLIPKRRTAFNVPAPAGMDIRGWPMVDDVGGQLYFKPDAGQLLVSPADATPSVPVDAQPDDLDVATGVERFEQATTYHVTRVSRTWAGLRTFAADASPVVGPDRSATGFIWLAGQGGYGIKTSPALSRACAALLRNEPLPDDLLRLGITAAQLLPDRLRAATSGGTRR